MLYIHSYVRVAFQSLHLIKTGHVTNRIVPCILLYYPFLFIPDFSSVFLTRFSMNLNFY